MTNHVDLTDLRSLTDGDKEMELALFKEFYTSSEALLGTLGKHCVDGPSETWRTTAHALKGSAYNLGAMGLGDLYKHAQENPAASSSDKQKLLEKMKTEYAA